MRTPKHRPTRPTTTDISDLLNEMYGFVHDNPEWMNDDESLGKMALAYGILAQISTPDDCTEQEFEFVMNLHTTIKEKMRNV